MTRTDLWHYVRHMRMNNYGTHVWFTGNVAFDHARYPDIVAFIRDDGIDVWSTDIVALMYGAQILWHLCVAHRFCGIDVWRTDVVASMYGKHRS